MITLASSYWSLWVRIPACVIGIAVFGILAMYGVVGAHERWQSTRRESWLRWGLVLLSLVGVVSWWKAWEEKRVIAAFAELFVAYSLSYGSILGGVIAGFYVGLRVYQKRSAAILHARRKRPPGVEPFQAKVLGVVVGIVVAVGIIAGAFAVGKAIPGVGWRIARMGEEGPQ